MHVPRTADQTDTICPWLTPAQARVVQACIESRMEYMLPSDRRDAYLASRSIAAALVGADVKASEGKAT